VKSKERRHPPHFPHKISKIVKAKSETVENPFLHPTKWLTQIRQEWSLIEHSLTISSCKLSTHISDSREGNLLLGNSKARNERLTSMINQLRSNSLFSHIVPNPNAINAHVARVRIIGIDKLLVFIWGIMSNKLIVNHAVFRVNEWTLVVDSSLRNALHQEDAYNVEVDEVCVELVTRYFIRMILVLGIRS
jgi:hypothetical protein